MKPVLSLISFIFFTLISITSWEFYWRSRGVVPDIEDDKHLWAVQRARLEKAGDSDVVIIGSSRALFDIQLDQWEALTGIRPIQLSSAGSTPLPAMRDIVENTSFKGTLIVGVTPGLFFSTTFPKAPPWKRIQNRINFYRERTYAQRFNHFLSLPLERNLAFISQDEEGWTDDINLRNLLAQIDLGQRTSKEPEPPFYRFQEIAEDRNVRMKEKVVRDTTFANTIKRIWVHFTPEDRNPDKESTMPFFLEDALKFLERGGNLILLRCPSDGYLRDMELRKTPRAEYWDELVRLSGAKAYHFEDYIQLQGFNLPEWSHLSSEDADVFTLELVKILLADNAITSKSK